MARRGKRKTARAEQPRTNRGDLIGPVLIGLAVAIGLLAIFQWHELLSVMEGGTTFCSINQSFDCETVWNSEFAKSIHHATKVPVAGWGLIYAFTALAAAYRFHRLRRAGKKEAEPIWAVRFVGAVGGAASLVLLLVSWNLGTLCLTCLGTYTLVAAYAVVAFRVPPVRPLSQTKPGRIVVVPGLYVLLGWLLLLWPGSTTPDEPKTHLPPPKVEQKVVKSDLELYVDRLPPEVRQAISDSLEVMRRSPHVDTTKHRPRHLHGLVSAPVHLLDFVDVRCTHCRQLETVTQELERSAPPGAFSLETRFFPLDRQCNPNMPKEVKDATGVRCLGPRILLCLEDKPGFDAAVQHVFEAQPDLTPDKLYEIASAETGATRAELDKCIAAPATEAKLKEDIDFAMEYQLEGTPLVVVNGKKATPLPSFLYAIVLAGGDPRHPAFSGLPPPSKH